MQKLLNSSHLFSTDYYLYNLDSIGEIQLECRTIYYIGIVIFAGLTLYQLKFMALRNDIYCIDAGFFVE